MITNSELDARIIAPLHFNKHLKDLDVAGNFYSKTSTSKYGFNKIYAKLSQAMTDQKILNFYPDVLHQTYYNSKVPKDDIKNIVFNVFDLIHEKFSPDARIIAHKKKSILEASHVICISESTKRDLQEYYAIDESKISIILLAASKLFSISTELIPIQNRNCTIVFVGQRSGYMKILHTNF